MANNDNLTVPANSKDLNKLIGSQSGSPVLKMLGTTLLSMVAIHYGSYALKNAGATILEQRLSRISLAAGRTTSIAEDILGIGTKLERYAAGHLGQITDTTPLSTEFLLRAKARAAKQLTRLPFEFIPAYLVQQATQERNRPQDARSSNLKTMGMTVLNYYVGDALLGAAAPVLARTQAAQYAKQNLERVGPDALRFIQKWAEKGTVGGSSSLKALGQMYRKYEMLPPEQRVPTASNLKSMWRTTQEQYQSSMSSYRTQVNESQLPSLFKLMRGTASHLEGMAAKNASDAYGLDWVANLQIAAADAGRPITQAQAEAIQWSIRIGQDAKNAHVPTNVRAPIRNGSAEWYTRFGHTEKSIGFNMEDMHTIIDKSVPALAGVNDTVLHDILQQATEFTDAAPSRGLWVGATPPGGVTPASTSSLSPGGYLGEQELKDTYDYALRHFGRVDPNKGNLLGVRKVSWNEYGRNLRALAAVEPKADATFTNFLAYDDLVANASQGGREGQFYQNWQSLAVDTSLLTEKSVHSNVGNFINFTLLRSQANAALTKIEGYTQIPVLKFNPLSLFQWRSHTSQPKSRWIPVGSYSKPLGIVNTPHFQIGDEISKFVGQRNVQTDMVVGALEKLPGRYQSYETSATTTMGRLVRNVTGMGVDTKREFADTKERWLYRRMPKVAKALGISQFTQGSIPTTVKNTMKGMPTLWLSRKLKNVAPGISQRLYQSIDESFYPKEFDMLMSGGITDPEQIARILNKTSQQFHPGLPPHVVERAREWAPPPYGGQHDYLRKRDLDIHGIPTSATSPLPTINTITLLEDVTQNRRSLIDIINLLQEDAEAQYSRNGNTRSLFNSMLKGGKQKLESIAGYEKQTLPPNRFAVGEYSVDDKVRRDIINYLLVRPTTINTLGVTRAGQFQAAMEVSDLENLVGAIERTAGNQGKLIGGQIKGAVASMKLTGYKAHFRDPLARVAAINADLNVRGELDSMVENWAKFPSGRGWRTAAPDQRNAKVVLNRFADEFTYLEKFGSAFKRDPLAAISGMIGPGGTKTGASVGALHMVNRLRGVLRLVGMDFEEGRFTNAADMLVGGFIMRRILPAMAAVEIYRYVDTKINDWTGKGLGERAFAAGVVAPTTAAAYASQWSGLQNMFKWFGKTTGEEDRMNFLRYATKGGAEMKEFWDQGEVPVRRGRWWILSPTPFKGQRTQFFVPNLYRRIKSRYQYTWEGGKGPEDFYFSHSWLPTPEHPLAPLNRITDPYAYEKATYNMRPYPLTGQFFGGPYGPLSPILNATIGEFIKPTKKMHPEGWAAMASGVAPGGGRIEGLSWPALHTSLQAGATSGLVRTQISSMNQALVGQQQAGLVQQPAYGIGAAATMMLMDSVGVPPQVVTAATPPGIWTQPVPIASMADTAYRMQEMSGIYGFGVQSIRTKMGLSGEYAPISYIPRANEGTDFQNKFWGAQLGGMGDFVMPGQGQVSNIEFSEIFRRFVPRRPTSNAINPIANSVFQQNPWLPGPNSGYFKDYSQGDVYSETYGALRFPGEAYQRAYGVTPDYGKGMAPYGPLDRLRILSKTAPWSLEYKAYNRSIARMDLTPGEQEQYGIIKSQVEQINKKYDFAPYRFKGMDLEQKSYTYMGTTPEGLLRVKGSSVPLKIAGVEQSADLSSMLSSRYEVGQQIDVQMDVNRPKYSLSQDQTKVLEVSIPGLTKDLIDKGATEETGGSPLSYAARTNPLERVIGSAWETITHQWNPFTTKFIQRRTALEEYERTNVYGLDYAPWTEPYKSFVRPQFDAVAAKSWPSSIIGGIALGAMTGKGGPAKALLGALGGSLLGLQKARVSITEAITGHAWVPDHVKERWKQEEYMDTLQYVAAAKNYSLFRQRALDAGEQDPEVLWQRDQSAKSWMASQKRNIQASILERSVYGGVAKKDYLAEHPLVGSAFQWREQMGKTAYGVNLNGDYLTMQQAIPKERRMYFEQFLNAPVKERSRILDLLPPNEKRIYQSAWDMPVDKRTGLNDYFDNKFLPGPASAVWDTNLDWDKTRIRMIENAGGQPSEYGYYPQEVQGGELYPVPVPTINMRQTENVKEMLLQILGGSPLQGLSVSVQPTSQPGFNMDFNITKDMRPMYDQRIAEQLGAL